MLNDIKTEQILSEREKTHGDYEKVSVLWVNLVNDIRYDVREEVGNLGCTKIAAIEMILLKIARIVHGDSNFADHWDDIAGYAMLGKGKNETIREKEDYRAEEPTDLSINLDLLYAPYTGLPKMFP